jgi:tetratricopeptide (TPR) repeat protein
MKNNPTITFLFDQALHYADQEQINQALQSYDQIIRIQPNNAIVYNNMGILFNKKCQYQKAEACFDRATKIDSSYANAWYNWGNTLNDQEKYELAIEKYKKAIACRHSFAEAYNNMGECFGKCNQRDQALIAFNKAVAINPKLVGTFFNLGNLYYKNSQYQQALQYFKHSIAIQPDYKDAHYHLSFTLLITGDYINGFKEYEWRLRRGPFTGERFIQPFWDGSPAQDKTLFVYCEQGFGDNIHFCRYLSMIAGKVKRIVFGARTEQARLIQTIPKVDQVIVQGDKLPQFDIHCSLLSLPFLFQTCAQTIPCDTPYLFPDILKQNSELDQTIEKQACDMLRVGIVWGGNPENKNDKLRSIPLASMGSLFSIPGIRWFSFQKGLHAKAIKEYESQIVDLSIYFNDFYDTALGLCQMDLLIAVDTSVAHLAGALGIPFWLLIPPQPDWRWLLDRSDSPWYPTCHIFRKAIDNDDWLNVVNQVHDALQSILSRKPNANAKAYFNEGVKHYQSGNAHMAAVSFQKVLSLYPISCEAEHNLLGIFAAQGNRHNAILYGQRVCRRNPQNIQAWQHLGKQYAHCEQIDTAIHCLLHAQKAGGFNDARVNYELGQLLLLNGQWQEGLRCYEFRRQCDFMPKRRKYDLPHWDGQPVKNKTILVYSEFQDKSFIMYLRFAPLLKELSDTVVLEATPGMYRLAMCTLRVDRIFYYPDNQDSESVDAFDIQVSLESLPFLLNLSREDITHDVPYLQPANKNIPLESFIHSYALSMKVGISWFSEPSEISNYVHLLTQLMPLFQLDDLSFFHIGYNALSSIASINIPENLIDLSKFLDDSHDLASAIDQMDIILSFDNLVGHIAGAMSKTVFMLLPKLPNWYWQMHTNQSDWYPSMTLFRDAVSFDWQTISRALIEKRHDIIKNDYAPTDNCPNHSIYVHAIGYFDGLTGCHIHTRSFFDAMSQYIPVLESDIQLPKRFNNSIDYINNKIMPDKKSIFNIAICQIHQLDMLSSCSGVKIGYVVWESTSIPEEWMASFSYTDIVWTPSQWFKKILINHGIDSHSIQVIPEGINGRIFTTEGSRLQFLKDINAYKFLYVGKVEERKATPEMIVTFDYAFKDNPDVRLIVAGQTNTKALDFNKCIQDLGLRHPEKIIRVGPFARSSELAALYRSCDAFVMPTRAEGWGLPIIEAMACGLPVIVTGYSGLTEFATNENAYLIDFTMTDILKPFGWQVYCKSSDYGQWAEPDFFHLSDMMQYVWKHQEEAKERGQKASYDIHSQWTWDHAAKKAIKALKDLSEYL